MIKRSRRGVSPVVASIILIAVTLSVGLALWGFVIGEAALSSGAMGESTASNVNNLREKFVITNVAFDYPTSGKVTVWFYNNGAINTQFKQSNGQIFIGDTSNPTDEPTGWISTSVTVEVKKSASITFDYTTTSETTYYIKAVGEFGNVILYYQKA